MNYQSMIENKLHPQGQSGNEIIYACPNCEDLDSGHHLYVNYDKNVWHCVKCGAGGRRLTSLLKLLNLSVDFDYESLYTEQDKSLDDIISMKKTTPQKDKIVDYSTDLTVLTEYYLNHIKYLSPEAYAYLRSRGLSDYLISSLGLMEGINRYGDKINIKGKVYDGRDYSDRIMIPSLRKDNLISFYLGRDYKGTRSNKYLNAPKEIGVASEDVWGLDLIESDSVVICEGVFSAISVNNALNKMIACATYGKSIAQKSSEIDRRVTSQGEKLLKRGFKNYIMFYDKDALEDSFKNAQYLHDRGATVKVVRIPENMYGPKADAGDMTREEIIKLIMEAEDYDDLSKIDLTL